MLDVQRHRGAIYVDEINFTRKLVWTHLIVGACVIALFLFHEVFSWFAGTAAWYGASLITMYGFMNGNRHCRFLLALFFLAAVVAGLYFINRLFPGLQPPRVPLIPHAFLPVWLGAVNLCYGAGTLLLLFNGKIRRASSVGFTLS